MLARRPKEEGATRSGVPCRLMLSGPHLAGMVGNPGADRIQRTFVLTGERITDTVLGTIPGQAIRRQAATPGLARLRWGVIEDS